MAIGAMLDERGHWQLLVGREQGVVCARVFRTGTDCLGMRNHAMASTSTKVEGASAWRGVKICTQTVTALRGESAPSWRYPQSALKHSFAVVGSYHVYEMTHPPVAPVVLPLPAARRRLAFAARRPSCTAHVDGGGSADTWNASVSGN
jgi:hypothetical protein